MLELTFSGSYFDIGRAFGKAVRETIPPPKPQPELQDFAFKCESLVKQHTPDLLEELKGYAEGTGLDYETVLICCLVPQGWQACNLLCVAGETTKEGHPIFVRHMDWVESDLKHARLLQTSPSGALSSLSFNFSDLGGYCGVNKAGLAIGSASIPFYNGKPEPGIKDNIATRWILDNYTRTSDAVELLERIPHVEAIGYLIGDKTGQIARVDASPKGSASEFTEDGIGIVCNFFTLDKTRDLDRMPENDRAYTYYKRIKQWFEKHRGKISLQQIKALCRDHDNGICEHLDDPLGGTIWSWISQIGTNTLEYTPGYPCKTEYKTRSITCTQ